MSSSDCQHDLHRHEHGLRTTNADGPPRGPSTDRQWLCGAAEHPAPARPPPPHLAGIRTHKAADAPGEGKKPPAGPRRKERKAREPQREPGPERGGGILRVRGVCVGGGSAPRMSAGRCRSPPCPPPTSSPRTRPRPGPSPGRASRAWLPPPGSPAPPCPPSPPPPPRPGLGTSSTPLQTRQTRDEMNTCLIPVRQAGGRADGGAGGRAGGGEGSLRGGALARVLGVGFKVRLGCVRDWLRFFR